MEPVRGQLACISLRILDAPGSSDPTPSSTSPDIIKTQRDSDKKRRGNPFLWKIEIYLIGQIYPTGTDTSPHNSLLRHISSQGRNLETFLEMVNFLDKRRKKMHSNTLIVSDGANFQGAKTQDTRVWAKELIRGSLNKPKSTKRAV